MGEFFVYILKSSVCLSILYLFYRLLLSRETFYNFNRTAILGILVVSLALPLCEITTRQQTEVQQTILTLEQLLMLADKFSFEETVSLQAKEITTALWIRVLILVYLIGVVFFLCRNIYSLLRLMKLIRSSIKFKIQKGIWLVSHPNSKYSPFSWMNYIVMYHNDMEGDNNPILIHEMAHIRKRHSIDLLITDICIILQWFNPAAWLFKRELQSIHEYQADEAVLDKGINAKQYQLLLIKKAAGTRLYSMANSFNHSKLKKRITMMLKEKSNPWARLKYLYVLPVAAIAITAFARPEISNELKEISAVKVNDLAGIVETNQKELPEKPDTIVLVADKLAITGSTTKGLSKIELSGEHSAAVMADNAIAFTFDPNAGQDDIRFTIQKVDTLSDDKEVKKIWFPDLNMKGKPLYVLDGNVVLEHAIESLNQANIETITVFKSPEATPKYGADAENGVVIIETKGHKKESGVAPVIVIDEVRATIEDMQKINPNDIQSVSVVKFDKMNDEKRSLALKYDALDAGGIIFVLTKNAAQQKGVEPEMNND